MRKVFLGSPESLPADSALGAGQWVQPNLRYVLEGCLRGLQQAGVGGAPTQDLVFPGRPPSWPQMELEIQWWRLRPASHTHSSSWLSQSPSHRGPAQPTLIKTPLSQAVRGLAWLPIPGPGTGTGTGRRTHTDVYTCAPM